MTLLERLLSVWTCRSPVVGERLELAGKLPSLLPGKWDWADMAALARPEPSDLGLLSHLQRIVYLDPQGKRTVLSSLV